MSETILEIKELKKSFGDNPILQGLSLDIKRGKSSSFQDHLVAEKYTSPLPQWLRNHTRWRYSSGRPVHYQQPENFHLVRQKIGMVFQSYELFPHFGCSSKPHPRPYQGSRERQKKKLPKKLCNYQNVSDFQINNIALLANYLVDKSNGLLSFVPFSCIQKSFFLTR